MNKHMCIHNFTFYYFKAILRFGKILSFFCFLFERAPYITQVSAGHKTKRASFPSGSRHQNFEHNPKTEINLIPDNILVD